MPGRGDRKRNGSEERNWGSQCFSTLNEMRQPRDALLLTPQVFSSLEAATVEDEVIVEEAQKEDVQNKRVFVLNLPWTYSVDDLKSLFGECGTVEDAQV
ncbi:28 kDa ribonucleoprotein, chloroplastic-like protein [Tanacetum coccineum]